MVSFLLPIIYVAFISLGLPDSILGSAWPIMFGELSVPVSYAGIISMIISGGTIVSSLLSDKITRKLGAGLVTSISVMMTACALLGFSLSRSFWVLCVLAVPYGLGAGSVDAALNNYVALHYASRHMSWLHCFWGVGATLGPYIMGWAIGAGNGWRSGYGIISVIQIVLTVILFVSLPIWKKRGEKVDGGDGLDTETSITLRDALRLGGVKAVLLTMLAYCAFESTAGLWASTYLVNHRGVDANTAATFASLFYLGITFGRFVSGFITDKLGDKLMIRYSCFITLVGVLLIALPLGASLPALIGLVVAGIGGAAVYPCVIHSTPEHFGREYSHAIVGIQMASAYCGSTLMPPIFGFIAQNLHIGIYPFYLLIFVLLMLFTSERVNVAAKKKKEQKNA